MWKNYRTLTSVIKNLNKWKDVHDHRSEELILLGCQFYRFKMFLSKLPADYLVDINKLIPKFILKR